MVWTITVLLAALILFIALNLLLHYIGWVGERRALTDLASCIAPVLEKPPTLVRLDSRREGFGYIDLLPHREDDGRTSIIAFVDVVGMLPSARRRVMEAAAAFNMDHVETVYRKHNVIRLKCGHDPARAARACRDVFVKGRNADPGMLVLVRQRFLFGKQED